MVIYSFQCLLIFAIAMSVSVFFYKFKQSSMNSSDVHHRQHAYLYACLLNATLAVVYIQFLTPVNDHKTYYNILT